MTRQQNGPTMTYPLGTEVVHSDYKPNRDVIAKPELTASGNTVLRAGTCLPSGGWEQRLHIVLTPSERDALIVALVAQSQEVSA